MIQRINGVVKDYSWGGYTYIPELIGSEVADTPAAEYWLGTHPDGMATLQGGEETLEAFLGRPLSYLFKVLDVRDMLSIQVHPDKATAEAGFEDEERRGVPRTAHHRVYKDANHKPELMVALSEFWLVQGFTKSEEMLRTLSRYTEFEPLLTHYKAHGLKALYHHIMTMSQEEVNAILKPLGKKIKPPYEQGKLSKEDIDFWAARAYFTFNEKGRCDRGILSLYLMNLVHLQPGEAVYQAPGLLHAYLEGQNIECMAASDNVVRGGLTKKHMDPEQLVEVVDFEIANQGIINAKAAGAGFKTYAVPVPDFALCRFHKADTIPVHGPSIAFNLGDTVVLSVDGTEIQLARGEAALLMKDASLQGENPVDLLVASSNR